MTKILGLILAFASTAASAQTISGIWKGTGQMTSSNSQLNGPCTSYEVHLEATDVELRIPKYEYKCGIIFSDWAPLRYKIRDGKIYHWEDDTEEGVVLGHGHYRLIGGGSGPADDLQIEILPNGTMKTSYAVVNVLGRIQVRGELPGQ